MFRISICVHIKKLTNPCFDGVIAFSPDNLCADLEGAHMFYPANSVCLIIQQREMARSNAQFSLGRI